MRVRASVERGSIRRKEVAMFSPKELEGEVDHSFFDSDGEPGKTIPQDPEEREGDHDQVTPDETETTRMEREAEQGGTAVVGKEEAVLKGETLEDVFSSLQVQSEEKAGSADHSSGTDDRKEDHSENSAVKEGKEGESAREDSDASSRKSSPLPRSDRSESRHSSQSEDSSSVRSYSSEEPRSDSSAEERDGDGVLKNDDDDDDDDGYSDTESEREKLPEPSRAKHHSEASRKSLGKFRTHSRSSSSDRESESGDLRSPVPSHKPSATLATSSPRRRPRPGSAKQKERAKTSESEDTVTDVTPLSTPDVSPGQSFDLSSLTEPSVIITGPQQQDVIEDPSITEVDAVRRRSSDADGDERSAVLSAGRRVDSVLVISSPSSASSSSCSSRRRRNFSFTNEEVRRIERENQRLLRELSRSSPHSRSGGSAHSSAARHSVPPTARLYHSTLNRQREQQRIQRENLAFLKRLESVKPTPGMTRAEQLADYQRQAGYLGIPTPHIRPPSGKGSRPCSTTSPRRTRPETAKPSRTTAPRPAWS